MPRTCCASQARSWPSGVIVMTGTPSFFSDTNSSTGTWVVSGLTPAGAKRNPPSFPEPTTSTSNAGRCSRKRIRSSGSCSDRLSVITMTFTGTLAVAAVCWARSSACSSPLRPKALRGMMSGSSGGRKRSKKPSSRVSGMTRWAVSA
ncbi:hypothetical protein D3C72_1561230 [compost metagenome]